MLATTNNKGWFTCVNPTAGPTSGDPDGCISAVFLPPRLENSTPFLLPCALIMHHIFPPFALILQYAQSGCAEIKRNILYVCEMMSANKLKSAACSLKLDERFYIWADLVPKTRDQRRLPINRSDLKRAAGACDGEKIIPLMLRL